MLKLLVILLFSCCVYCRYNPFDSPMCQIKGNSSCSYLFDEDADDFCWKVYYNVNNLSSCEAAYDEDAVRTNKKNYGRLILEPFFGDLRTVFNVSFVDITFKILKIRFQAYHFETRKMLKECMVKDFILKDSVPSNKTFTYVCPWSDFSYEGHFVHFHYEYGLTEYETRKKILFWVPKHNVVETDEYFFTYMDYTDIYNLTLNIVPKILSNITQYEVEVIYTFDGESSIKDTKILTADDSGLLQYSYYTAGNIGDYYFRVIPNTNDCKNNKTSCKIQETPKLHIADESSSLLIGMVGVSLMIPIFMIIVYMWTRQWPWPRKLRPNVLLVTVPTNDAHVHVAPAFAEFLQEKYNINVMLDEIDVPKTADKHCSKWLKAAIDRASHIIYLRSNDNLGKKKVVYENIYEQTIHWLHPTLNPNRKKECIISFSYSSETTKKSHPDLVHITKTNRFIFKENCNRFKHFLIGKRGALNKTGNYQKLLKTIEMVKMQPLVNNEQQKIINVHCRVSDDEDDVENQLPLRNIESDDDDYVIPNINFDLYNIYDEPNHDIVPIDDEHNSGSDFDDCNLYGDVKNI